MQAADARWAAKPSFLDKPRPRKLDHGIRDGQIEGTTKTPFSLGEDMNNEVREAAGPREKQNDSPRELQQKHSGQVWQPEAWSPQPLKK